MRNVAAATREGVEHTFAESFTRAVNPHCSMAVVKLIRSRSVDRATIAAQSIALAPANRRKMAEHVTDAVLEWCGTLSEGTHVIDIDTRALELAMFVLVNAGKEDFKTIVRESTKAALKSVVDSVLDTPDTELERDLRLSIAESVFHEAENARLPWEKPA
jgi:hypothetical protein